MVTISNGERERERERERARERERELRRIHVCNSNPMKDVGSSWCGRNSINAVENEGSSEQSSKGVYNGCRSLDVQSKQIVKFTIYIGRSLQLDRIRNELI